MKHRHIHWKTDASRSCFAHLKATRTSFVYMEKDLPYCPGRMNGMNMPRILKFIQVQGRSSLPVSILFKRPAALVFLYLNTWVKGISILNGRKRKVKKG